MSFALRLSYGRIAENKIAQWLMAKGSLVLPVYETELEGSAKGPRVFLCDSELVAPDLLVFTKQRAHWIEAKRKSRFTWHRKTRTWQTGIDVGCYNHYLQIADQSPFPLWLLFLHEDSTPDARDIHAGSEPQCPVGLYGRDIQKLRHVVDHSHNNWGRTGMVYWRESVLQRIATIAEVNAAVSDGIRRVQ
jgi:hypothetical protein